MMCKQFVRQLKKEGCVLLVTEPLLSRSERPNQEVISEIRKRQHDRGHQPLAKEGVDRYLQLERGNWE